MFFLVWYYLNSLSSRFHHHISQISCTCGRPSPHPFKQGLIFSNFLILKKITNFLHSNDLRNFKAAFCNFSMIEDFIHKLICKYQPFKLYQGCTCIHTDIVTIWIKYKYKIQKVKRNKKIQIIKVNTITLQYLYKFTRSTEVSILAIISMQPLLKK